MYKIVPFGKSPRLPLVSPPLMTLLHIFILHFIHFFSDDGQEDEDGGGGGVLQACGVVVWSCGVVVEGEWMC